MFVQKCIWWFRQKVYIFRISMEFIIINIPYLHIGLIDELACFNMDHHTYKRVSLSQEHENFAISLCKAKLVSTFKSTLHR